MMNAPELGKLITTTVHRDAIHIAVAPVEAATTLQPGQHVTVVDGKAYGGPGKQVGIVDPFLMSMIKPGEKFYLFLYPNTILSLRHEWVHPAFPETTQPEKSFDKAKAEEWLRDYAAKVRPYDAEGRGKDYAYRQFIEDAKEGDIFYHGRDCHGLYDVDDANELFENLSIVLGYRVNGDSFSYSCSC